MTPLNDGCFSKDFLQRVFVKEKTQFLTKKVEKEIFDETDQKFFQVRPKKKGKKKMKSNSP